MSAALVVVIVLVVAVTPVAAADPSGIVPATPGDLPSDGPSGIGHGLAPDAVTPTATNWTAYATSAVRNGTANFSAYITPAPDGGTLSLKVEGVTVQSYE